MQQYPEHASAMLAAMRGAVAAAGPSSTKDLTPLRDHALATGVLADILAFLPVNERLQVGQVSKRWHIAQQQPSVWRDAGWHLTCHFYDQRAKLPLPLWLSERMSTVRCVSDWLL
jgi:hypothetical protein